MKAMKHGRFGVVVTSGLLAAAILVGLVSVAVNRTILQPKPVQTAIAESGAYGQVVPLVLAQYDDKTVAGVAVDDPAVRRAAEESFSPAYLTRITDPAIANTYQWLHGEIERPDFRINYQEGRREFAQRVGGLIADRAEDLPTCSLSQTLRLGLEFRALLAEGRYGDIECLPPGISRALIIEVVSRYIETGIGQEGPIATGTLPAREVTLQGEPFYEHPTVARLPGIVEGLAWLPWICLAVAVLALGLIYALRRSLHVVALHLAVSLVVVGLITAIASFSLSTLVDRLISPRIEPLAGDIVTALTALTADWLRPAAIITILAGAALLIMLQWQTLRRLRHTDT